MIFSTDKFLRSLKEMLDGISTDYLEDMANEATGHAIRLKMETNNEKALALMVEIGVLAEMSTNMKHDCKKLYDKFDQQFQYNHGDKKHSATALDTMKIITEIGARIDNIAPHLGFLFERSDEVIPSLFRNSFIEERTTFEIPAEWKSLSVIV